MTLLKDLIDLKAQQAAKQSDALEEETQLNEASMDALLDKFIDQNKMYSFEGSRGVRHLLKILAVIDYRSFDAFFEDNPGAIEGIIEFIKDHANGEWRSAFEDEVDMEGDDDEDDDDK